MLFFAAALALPAASAASVTLEAGQTITVQTITAGGAKITLLRFSDSRCPERAICVMAGNVKASLFVVRGKSARLYTVYLPGVPVQTLAGKVELKAATRGVGQKLRFEVEK
ncbi:hypothetical protein [Deinococcus arenicola]|uniref:Uncharacterized protein n=1 Tax=Deinococcus arenicola TaxID=2994950 RepID=A0ABU4DVQ7_9DEIO|nr:hypothetical protein [Deinococcus sp. ZS9-10]MDV6375935.1 hypothetical protein [Deinococcus sp. ZS9-10]